MREVGRLIVGRWGCWTGNSNLLSCFFQGLVSFFCHWLGGRGRSMIRICNKSSFSSWKEEKWKRKGSKWVRTIYCGYWAGNNNFLSCFRKSFFSHNFICFFYFHLVGIFHLGSFFSCFLHSFHSGKIGVICRCLLGSSGGSSLLTPLKSA